MSTPSKEQLNIIRQAKQQTNHLKEMYKKRHKAFYSYDDALSYILATGNQIRQLLKKVNNGSSKL